MLVVSCAYLIRCITVLMTYLPSPFYGCITFPHPSIAVDAFMIMFKMRDTCGDVFFSGYAIHYTVSSLTWWHYPVHKHPAAILASLPIVIFNLLCSLALVATQHSYTNDVIAGMMITWGLFVVVFWVNDVDYLRFETIIGLVFGFLDDPFYSENKKRYFMEKEFVENARKVPAPREIPSPSAPIVNVEQKITLKDGDDSSSSSTDMSDSTRRRLSSDSKKSEDRRPSGDSSVTQESTFTEVTTENTSTGSRYRIREQ